MFTVQTQEISIPKNVNQVCYKNKLSNSPKRFQFILILATSVNVTQMKNSAINLKMKHNSMAKMPQEYRNERKFSSDFFVLSFSILFFQTQKSDKNCVINKNKLKIKEQARRN